MANEQNLIPMERDEKGRFVKGNNEGRRFASDGSAAANALRSQKAQAEKKTLREALVAELNKKAKAGEPMTKLEYLVAKAIDNHARGKLTFKDLTALLELLGEKELTVTHKTDGPLVITEAEAQALDKWAGK